MSAMFESNLPLDMRVSDLLLAIGCGKKSDRPDKTLRCALRKYALEVSPSKKGRRWELLRLAAFERQMSFIDVDIAEVQTSDLAMWRDTRIGQTSASTATREMTLLHGVFAVACKEWLWLRVNPMKGLRRPMQPPPRDRRISALEIDLIISELGYQVGAKPTNVSQRIAVAWLFAIETGMRCGEICALKWKHVNIKRRFVRIETSKNGDSRCVPLSRQALVMIRLMSGGDDMLEDSIFKLSTPSVDVLFRKARTRAGITNLHFHDSRHEAITRLAQKLEILDLARMVGMRDLSTLTIYYNAAPEEIAARLDG